MTTLSRLFNAVAALGLLAIVLTRHEPILHYDPGPPSEERLR